MPLPTERMGTETANENIISGIYRMDKSGTKFRVLYTLDRSGR